MKTRLLFLLVLLGVSSAQTGTGDVEFAIVFPRSVLLARARNEQKIADIFAIALAMGSPDDAALAQRAQGRADVWAEIIVELDRKSGIIP